MRDEPFCFWHAPETADEAVEARRLGGLHRRKKKSVAAIYGFGGLRTIIDNGRARRGRAASGRGSGGVRGEGQLTGGRTCRAGEVEGLTTNSATEGGRSRSRPRGCGRGFSVIGTLRTAVTDDEVANTKPFSRTCARVSGRERAVLGGSETGAGPRRRRRDPGRDGIGDSRGRPQGIRKRLDELR